MSGFYGCDNSHPCENNDGAPCGVLLYNHAVSEKWPGSPTDYYGCIMKSKKDDSIFCGISPDVKSQGACVQTTACKARPGPTPAPTPAPTPVPPGPGPITRHQQENQVHQGQLPTPTRKPSPPGPTPGPTPGLQHRDQHRDQHRGQHRDQHLRLHQILSTLILAIGGGVLGLIIIGCTHSLRSSKRVRPNKKL